MKKTFLSLMLILLSVFSSSAQNFWNGSATVSTITSSGRVGIGMTPINNDLLAVHTSSTIQGNIMLQNTSSGTAKKFIIASYGSVGAGNHWSGFSSANTIGLYSELPLVISSPNGLYFSGNQSAEHMRISNSGGVSIAKELSVSGGSVYGVSGTCSLGWGGFFTGNYGVWGVTDASTGTIGVRGTSNRSNMIGVQGDNSAASGFGVYGDNSGTSGYGVFGRNSGTGGLAGYSVGNVYSTGNISWASDRKLKENEKEIKGAIDILRALKPKSYNYKVKEYRNMSLPGGKSVGFIAQELQQVLPELVTTILGPVEKDDKGNIIKEREESLAVNYVALIPYLVAAIQEQEQKIDKLGSSLKSAALRSTPTDIGSQKANALEQNNPNPFDQATSIKYSLAEHNSASIYIYNLSGEQIKKFDITSKGEGKVDINGSELKAGMYIYALIVDGKEVEPKKMILTK